jgi:hypothetical protein
MRFREASKTNTHIDGAITAFINALRSMHVLHGCTDVPSMMQQLCDRNGFDDEQDVRDALFLRCVPQNACDDEGSVTHAVVAAMDELAMLKLPAIVNPSIADDANVSIAITSAHAAIAAQFAAVLDRINGASRTAPTLTNAATEPPVQSDGADVLDWPCRRRLNALRSEFDALRDDMLASTPQRTADKLVELTARVDSIAAETTDSFDAVHRSAEWHGSQQTNIASEVSELRTALASDELAKLRAEVRDEFNKVHERLVECAAPSANGIGQLLDDMDKSFSAEIDDVQQDVHNALNIALEQRAVHATMRRFKHVAHG